MYNYRYKDFHNEDTYIKLDEHIEKYNPKWRSAIPKDGEGNNDSFKTINEAIIAWEGTKYYFLKKMGLNDNFLQNWEDTFLETGLRRICE